MFRYADEMFSLGQEMMGMLKGRTEGRLARLTVGVADVLPKLVAYQLIEPALRFKDPYRIVCREGINEDLLLSAGAARCRHSVDRFPIDLRSMSRCSNHLLGECGMILFGAPKLTAQYRRGFPRSIGGATLLMPTRNTTARRSLDRWFDGKNIVQRIIAEFEDSALLKVFGQHGLGLFFAPSVISAEVQKQYWSGSAQFLWTAN